MRVLIHRVSFQHGDWSDGGPFMSSFIMCSLLLDGKWVVNDLFSYFSYDKVWTVDFTEPWMIWRLMNMIGFFGAFLTSSSWLRGMIKWYRNWKLVALSLWNLILLLQLTFFFSGVGMFGGEDSVKSPIFYFDNSQRREQILWWFLCNMTTRLSCLLVSFLFMPMGHGSWVSWFELGYIWICG